MTKTTFKSVTKYNFYTKIVVTYKRCCMLVLQKVHNKKLLKVNFNDKCIKADTSTFRFYDTNTYLTVKTLIKFQKPYKKLVQSKHNLLKHCTNDSQTQRVLLDDNYEIF